MYMQKHIPCPTTRSACRFVNPTATGTRRIISSDSNSELKIVVQNERRRALCRLSARVAQLHMPGQVNS